MGLEPESLPRNVVYLLVEAPTPSGDMPQSVDPRDRQLGVTLFSPTSGAQSDGAGSGHVTGVYYLAGWHDPRRVIHAFLRANPHLEQRMSLRTIHYLLSGERSDDWKAASKDILKRRYGDDAWAKEFG